MRMLSHVLLCGGVISFAIYAVWNQIPLSPEQQKARDLALDLEVEQKLEKARLEKVIAKTETFVRESLRSPSTAVFGGAVAKQRDNGIWTVWGHVDAQNGYGAMIRADYVATVHEDFGLVTLIDLDLESR
ncbi:MAG TPA: hypothetical protein VJ809_16540 [Pirellulales bacterium]|jgi:hypothetical protein|nr:hypothetical protein [Pirellulales bacterium]